MPPDGFVLTRETFLGNGCGTRNGNAYEINANCCISLTLTYDAAAADLGQYSNQGVRLSGPFNQTYLDYEGHTSDAEDVTLDGTIDCPTTDISFHKSVDRDTTCDQSFLTYEFVIANQTIVPLRGLVLRDTLPSPSYWTFEPYQSDNIDIQSFEINDSILTVVIGRLRGMTDGSFRMDAQLSTWTEDEELSNVAYLSQVPDFDAGGVETLVSDPAVTQIISSPAVVAGDTLIADSDASEVAVSISALLGTDFRWSTAGDGSFVDSLEAQTTYLIGTQDSIDGWVILNVAVQTECREVNQSIHIQLIDCAPSAMVTIGDCDDNGTDVNPDDDYFDLTVTASSPIGGNQYVLIVGEDELGPIDYGAVYVIADLLADGLTYTYEVRDVDNSNCSTTISFSQNPCSSACRLRLESMDMSPCDDKGTASDSSDDTFVLDFNVDGFNLSSTNEFTLLYSGVTEVYLYGQTHSVELPADGAEVILLFTDSEEPDCILEERFTAPMSCSDECVLRLESMERGACDNAGTPSDPSDDTWMLTLLVDGNNVGSSFSINGANPLDYDTEHMIILPADGLSSDLRITDSDDSSCLIDLPVMNELSCSSDCELNIEVLEASGCDDGGTPTDPSDDTYDLSIRVAVANGGPSGTFDLAIGNTVEVLSFNVLHRLTVPALMVDGGIEISDTDMVECRVEQMWVGPGPCSDLCLLNIVDFDLLECDDNATDEDRMDDLATYEFVLTSTQDLVSQEYTLLIDGELFGTYLWRHF